MTIAHSQSNRGVALIIVMMVIVVLGFLAGRFAYSMRVETTLARNANFGSDLEWLGRSGVELARYVLGIHMTVPNEGNYDALNQKWAGGPMGTNEALANISLENNELGPGTFSIKIVDLERRYNINLANDVALRLAMNVIGVDAADAPIVADSILDWIDGDDNTHLSGTESDYYLSLDPPYIAKNGPIDDLSELLLIRGVTPEMYWGGAASSFVPAAAPRLSSNRFLSRDEPLTYPVGLVDLFTPVSARVININTAAAEVFQLIPGIDENIAGGIVSLRAGPDGVDGTEDDIPFRNAGELINVPGLTTQGVQVLARLFSVRSATFEVTVQAEVGGQSAEWVALLRRDSPQDVKVLSMYRK